MNVVVVFYIPTVAFVNPGQEITQDSLIDVRVRKGFETAHNADGQYRKTRLSTDIFKKAVDIEVYGSHAL